MIIGSYLQAGGAHSCGDYWKKTNEIKRLSMFIVKGKGLLTNWKVRSTVYGTMQVFIALLVCIPKTSKKYVLV